MNNNIFCPGCACRSIPEQKRGYNESCCSRLWRKQTNACRFNFSPRLTAKFLSSLATIFEIYEMVFPFYPNLYDKLNDTNILIGSFKTSWMYKHSDWFFSNYDLLKDRHINVSINIIMPFCRIKQIFPTLTRVCTVIGPRKRQIVVRTSMSHSAAPHVPLFCSYHISMSSVIYFWTDGNTESNFIWINKMEFRETKMKGKCTEWYWIWKAMGMRGGYCALWFETQLMFSVSSLK